MKKVFLGTVLDGSIEWGDYNPLYELDKYEGSRVKFSIEDKKRTTPQNSLYWAYLHIISRETGNDVEDLHYSFRFSFLAPQLVEVTDFNSEKRTMVAELRSTTSLSKQEFTEYMQRIEAQTGIPIPNSDDVSSYFEE